MSGSAQIWKAGFYNGAIIFAAARRNKPPSMLVGPGGRERTEREYRALLAKVGFALTRVVPTASAVSIEEAIPV